MNLQRRRRGRTAGILIGLLAGLLAACAPLSGGSAAGEGTLALSSASSAADVSFQGELFLPTDPQIEARLQWPGFRDGTVLEWAWLDPDGRVFYRELRQIVAEEDWVRMPVADTEAARRPGRWQVVVRSPKGLVAARDFFLVASKNRWRFEHAVDANLQTQALQDLCTEADYGYLGSHYAFTMPAQAKGIIFDCLDRNLEPAVTLLAEHLQNNPQQETFLALLYRLKGRLIDRLLAGSGDRLTGLEVLARLRTPWDGPAFARLLPSPEAEIRRAGVELVGQTGSDETVLLLEKVLADADPAVRAAAITVLQRLGTAEAEEVLAAVLQKGAGRDATKPSGL